MDEASVLDESREMVVASVEAELKTLAELVSIEFKVEARLCLDVLLLSMLMGRDDGAVRPGDSCDAADFGDVLVEVAQRRPKKREAAVVTSDVREAFAVAICASL